jgi:hypothetical protein
MSFLNKLEAALRLIAGCIPSVRFSVTLDAESASWAVHRGVHEYVAA